MCVQNLKEFLGRWKDTYTEEHPLSEMFKKIIMRVLRKTQGNIENAEYAKWFNELFLENMGNNGVN